ncbi:MAG TPA: S8 family serine peptidase [Thauera sp.]|uniref:subtilisin-like serine protease QhpE n=1 Tax=Thauera sp. TaxID=1905334 RepID=UPI002C856E91|nr:S8 family serine peptidase [Thauera sp.]HRP22446.1 S8 family serine peptidase [Thauera sp.]HRP65827.1 S8 family serine peptidase [Thauera sp.]
MALRIAVVDSGCAVAHAPRVRAAAAFVVDHIGLNQVPATGDTLGHGSRVADILLHCAPQADLLVAQVFRERLTTTAAQVAAAIDWAVASDAQLVNLSLGLREPRPVLAEACARATAAGVVLCAAAPARGAAVYPAAFPGVLRVTGDARCAPAELATIGTAQVDFGAHVRPLDGSLTGAGASMACAWFSGLAARYLVAGGSADGLRAALAAQASHHGVDNPRTRQHGG